MRTEKVFFEIARAGKIAKLLDDGYKVNSVCFQDEAERELIIEFSDGFNKVELMIDFNGRYPKTFLSQKIERGDSL